MEAICVKLDKQVLINMDKTLKKNNYSTRTDFIREAIRDKMNELEKSRAIKELEKYFGSVKKKTSDKRLREIREKVGQEILKKHKLD